MQFVSPAYAVWHACDPAVKAEVFSTAIKSDNGLLLVDPIPLQPGLQSELRRLGDLTAIIITNANHARASADFGGLVPIYVPAALAGEFPSASVLRDGTSLHGLDVIALDGAAPGELALHDPRHGGSLIIGDALINFEPHGFTLLPAKYCTDGKGLTRSLRRLLDLSFTRLFFAHGFPVVTSAHDRLAALLRENS